ncbi:MAG: hypothetical protein WCI78_00490 [Mycobacterium sp.]
MSDGDTPATPADIRSLADQAEAEAAEAEALAAAARARARAIGLRREAEQVEARSAEAAVGETAADTAPDTAEVSEAATDAAATEAADTEAVDTEAVDTEAVDTEAVDTGTALAPVAPRRWGRVAGRLGRPTWSTLATALAAAVILGALAGSGYMIKAHRDAVRQRQLTAEFDAAARQGVVTLTTLDFNHAKPDVQRILDNSTGTFKDDFAKTANDFTKVVEQSKVTSQGSIAESAVDRDTVTENSAVVLVASTQEVTNAAGAKKDPRTYRLIVTVSRDGGQIKIAKVEFVP